MRLGFIPRSLLGCLLFSLIMPAWSHELPQPDGDVMLTVSGDISNPNVGDEARFDRQMLDALPSRVIETHTPWTNGKSRYEGPLATAVLDAAGARGTWFEVRALNDFAAKIPRSDLEEYAVILAMERDGEPMPIREYGPIFVLYPFDDHPELRNETIRFRSVWQVSNIHVE
ncbi:oxidoreductase [Aidingimonas lacisalsi]|uniref:oxidoreductase n=1 Tax=Aidingimonas lacisalsi TaxID=2604086 RepID=UPI0011D23615|nr:oxidoreductase [Aidingimonas lacisalsi]